MTVSKQAKPLALVPAGMMFLVLALTLPRVVHPSTSLRQGMIDGFQGVLFGFAIGFNLLAVILLARQRRRAKG